MVKRILNTTTGKYYAIRQKTTENGTAGQIMGLWKPKKTTVKASGRTSKKREICQKCPAKKGGCPFKCYEHDSDKFESCNICGQMLKKGDMDGHLPEYSEECEECGRTVCEDCTSRLSERDHTNDVVCIKCEPKKRKW